MPERCNWSGDAVIRDTVIWDKRAILGSQDIYIPTDIRSWLKVGGYAMKRTLNSLDLPEARESGTFDLRAWKIWKHVSESIEYQADKSGFWLHPEETLNLCRGGCEDSSILLASLLLASGISDHCLRVVLGRVFFEGEARGHAWTVYQCEDGQWCLLDSTLGHVPENLIPADTLAGQEEAMQYQPMFCFNRHHLWRIWPCRDQMADYLKIRETESQKHCQTLPFMEMEAF